MKIDLLFDNYMRGSGSADTWHVDIDPPKRKVKSYFEETKWAIDYIYSHIVDETFLLFSGGLDSQYVFNVYRKLGIPFTPVIIRHGDGNGECYNEPEVKYAFEICESAGIKPLVKNFNMTEFFEGGEATEMGESVECGSFKLLPTLKTMSELPGFVVFGNDPPYIKNLNMVWHLEEMQSVHGLLRYCKKFNYSACPYLLSYTPEMMLSFLIDPICQDLAANKLPGKRSTQSSKATVFNNGSGFNMKNYDYTAGYIKRDGYEWVTDEYINVRPKLKQYIDNSKNWKGIYYVDYYDIVEKLSVNQ